LLAVSKIVVISTTTITESFDSQSIRNCRDYARTPAAEQFFLLDTPTSIDLNPRQADSAKDHSHIYLRIAYATQHEITPSNGLQWTF
jgi:hypothetical protein